jgi:iron complex transport system substrate-binding protein
LCAVFATLICTPGAAVLGQNLAQDSHPPSSGSVTVTDDTGRDVALTLPIRRIVSLAPSVTETIFALDAGDRLVGDTDYCDYPPEAKTKTKVGGVIDPNLEQVVALRPDVVVAAKTANRLETVRALERLHIPVYGTDAHSVDDMLQSIQHLAEVLGAVEQGKAVVASLRDRLDELQRKLQLAQPVRVLFVVWREPLISIGRQTFLADALRHAGAESIVDTQQDWPHVSLEAVVQWQPEYLIFANNDPAEAQSEIASMRDEPGWRDLKAVQQNRVVVLSEAVNRPVPRLVDAIEQLAHALHPEAFTAPAPSGAGEARATGATR